ncbi:late embryogenesis abundant protein D-29-like [Cucurbita maxima]|uniref:Late embryogenesis abundant protein D-29-like n=1 Tax=Cucurbita maxima TaxID=3661 RepID=A0A6J1J6J8_CUCMA|nr:late embryogenesis abundant protein D-29-like [Cucurbita maxima]
MGTSTWSFVAVLWLLWAVEMGVVEKCRGEIGQGAVKDVKDNITEITEMANLDGKAEALKKGASEVFNDAKDAAESWSNWASAEISKGLGLEEEGLKQTAHHMMDKAGDAKTKAKETLVNGKEKAAKVYEAAKTEVEREVAAVKECVNCEAAKEMASHAAVQIGAKIREKSSEL